MYTKKSLDIMTEIINIGTGDAASSLSDLVDNNIIITAPDVRILPVVEIQRYIAKEMEAPGIYISQDFKGNISGKSVLHYSKECSISLLNMLFKGKKSVSFLTSAEISTLQEIGNILLGAYISTISDIMSSQTTFGLPEVTFGVSDRYFENMLHEMAQFDQALVAKNEILIKDSNIMGFLFMLMSFEDFQKVIDTIKLNLKEGQILLEKSRLMRFSRTEMMNELQRRNLELSETVTERNQAVEELKNWSGKLEETVRRRTNQLQRRTDDLEAANRQLQELDRLKSMFIASMSHELRTPLNSIIGFTGILLMELAGELNPEQKKQLNMVKSSGNHLLNLINDIIDLSKIEAGKAEVEMNDFDLSAMALEVKEFLQEAADKKSLKISLQSPDELKISSDQRRVRQILLNFMGNAVKFTAEGKIDLTVSKTEETAVISVQDTGPGIKKEDLDKLFKAFSRISHENIIHEGTGLGLYLSNKIAALLKGWVSVESEYGRGSRFTLTLPLGVLTNIERKEA